MRCEEKSRLHDLMVQEKQPSPCTHCGKLSRRWSWDNDEGAAVDSRCTGSLGSRPLDKDAI
jgi:hypothetical protein